MYANRPKLRSDCIDGPRPCPYVSCKHHLYLDVAPNDRVFFNFRHLEVWELAETCSLDIADRGGVTLQEVAGAMGLNPLRIRQIECNVLARYEAEWVDDALRDPPPMRQIRWHRAVPGQHLLRRRKMEPWRKRAIERAALKRAALK